MARLRDYHYYVAGLPFLCTTIWNPDQISNGSTIWKPDTEKSGIQMVTVVWFSKGRALAMAIAIVPAIQKLDIFVLISNGFWQNGGLLSGFQMVGDPRSQIQFEIQNICNATSFLPFKI